MNKPTLTESDFRSQTWSRLTKDLQERLQELRQSNDSSQLSQDQTFLIRGQIKEVKRLLSLSTESAGMSGTPFTGDANLSDFPDDQ